MRGVIEDGRVCLDGRVSLDADDPGLTLGQCAFETLRTYGRRPFRPEEHLARLEASAQALGVPMPAAAVLLAEISLALALVPEGECNVRIALTAGGTRVVRALPLARAAHAARVATREWEPPPWLPGWIKHTSRAGSALVVAGVDEVLWVDRAGMLLEGTRSSVFAVVSGVLRTPPADGRILAGVTRQALLEAAQEIGVPTSTEPLRLAEPFDELYLASTLRELQPVISLNGAPAPGGGAVGAAVLAAFRTRT